MIMNKCYSISLWMTVFQIITGLIHSSTSTNIRSRNKQILEGDDYHKFLCSHKDEAQVLALFDHLLPSGSPTVAFGPQPVKVCIFTYLTEDILNYAQYSLLINGFYASLYGHDFYVIHPKNAQLYNMDLDNYDARWNKVKLLYDSIQQPHGWGAHCDYILWVDADWIILDFKWDIAQIISKHPHAYIITSAEHAGSTTMMNSGSVLVQNAVWSRQFLRDWWTIADRRLFSDQEQFDMLYQRYMKENNHTLVEKRIAILAPEAMNSDPPAMTQLRAHHQVLHLMGEENEYRIAVFRQAWSSICQYISEESDGSSKSATKMREEKSYRDQLIQGNGLPMQLSIHQTVLLQFALDIYGDLLLKHFQPLLLCRDGQPLHPNNSRNVQPNTQENKDICKQLQSLETCRRLGNMVHHYVHALDYFLSHTDISTTTTTENGSESKSLEVLRKQYQFLSMFLGHSDPFRTNVSLEEMKTTLLKNGQQLRYKLYLYLQHIALLWQESFHLPKVPIIHTEKTEQMHSKSYSDSTAKPKMPKDYPELVKTLAIAGQHLLAANAHNTLTLQQRLLIVDDLEQYLELLFSIADSRQHPAIQQMAIHHLLQEGEIAWLELQQINVATTCFQQALSLARSIQPVFGNHHAIQPLVMLANMFAIQAMFVQAMPLYEEAARYTRQHLGPWHISLAQLYYNHACACRDAGEHKVAQQLLQNIESILMMQEQQYQNQERVSVIVEQNQHFSHKVLELRRELMTASVIENNSIRP